MVEALGEMGLGLGQEPALGGLAHLCGGGVSAQGALRVKTHSGVREVSSAEISVRPVAAKV